MPQSVKILGLKSYMAENFYEGDEGPLGPVGRAVTGRRTPGDDYVAAPGTEPGQTYFTPDSLSGPLDDYQIARRRQAGAAAFRAVTPLHSHS